MDSWKWTALTITWLLLVGVGFVAMFAHANKPGEPARLEGMSWPVFSRLERESGRPTLVVFLHPKCGCSRATAGELERLLPFLKDRARVTVVFMRPPGSATDWLEGDLWDQVRRMPGVATSIDEGAEQSVFGAKTSGQTYLFDEKGTLVYEGGLTPARGHMGDSPGRDAILTWMESHRAILQTGRVFGCALQGSGEPASWGLLSELAL